MQVVDTVAVVCERPKQRSRRLQLGTRRSLYFRLNSQSSPSRLVM